MDETQREALERTIEAGAAILTNQHAALLALCRMLADQMDEAGYEDGGPSTRLSAAYLSALKDLSRAVTIEPEKQRAGGKLAHLRAVEGGRTNGRTGTR